MAMRPKRSSSTLRDATASTGRLDEDCAVPIDATATGDRHDCPRCRGAWIRIVMHDRKQLVLGCLRCGEWFSVPSAPQLRSLWINDSPTFSNLADVVQSGGSPH